jgi:hypothetical protein
VRLVICFVSDISTLVAGEKVCIRVLGNPLPIAVGRAEIDGTTLMASREGKAVAVVQVFGDLLWQQCRGSVSASISGVGGRETELFPNEGFLRGLNQVVAVCREDIAGGVESEEEEAGDAGVGGKEEEHGWVDETASLSVSVGVGVEGIRLSEDIVEDTQAEEEGNGEDVGGEREEGGGGEAVAVPSELQAAPAPLSPAQVDELYLAVTLRVLKYVVKDKDLPLLVSAFWSNVNR